MSYAFGHLVGAWFAGKIYEFFSKREVRYYTWFFLLLGGILPDIDFLLDWTIKTEFHRTFTHSFIFVFAAPLLVYLFFTIINKQEKEKLGYALFLGIGILMHLILDMLHSPGVPLLYPSLTHFAYSNIGYFDPATPSFLAGDNAYSLKKALKSMVFDMAIGTTWIFYLWFRKKLSF